MGVTVIECRNLKTRCGAEFGRAARHDVSRRANAGRWSWLSRWVIGLGRTPSRSMESSRMMPSATMMLLSADDLLLVTGWDAFLGELPGLVGVVLQHGFAVRASPGAQGVAGSGDGIKARLMTETREGVGDLDAILVQVPAGARCCRHWLSSTVIWSVAG